jgi:hypothetical protein
MTSDKEDLLALLIIAHHKFANAYELYKVLAWKFGIINCHQIITRIKGKHYITVTFPKSPTLGFFDLTVDGKGILQNGEKSLFNSLTDNFPEQVEFIQMLFGAYRS